MFLENSWLLFQINFSRQTSRSFLSYLTSHTDKLRLFTCKDLKSAWNLRNYQSDFTTMEQRAENQQGICLVIFVMVQLSFRLTLTSLWQNVIWKLKYGSRNTKITFQAKYLYNTNVRAAVILLQSPPNQAKINGSLAVWLWTPLQSREEGRQAFLHPAEWVILWVECGEVGYKKKKKI